MKLVIFLTETYSLNTLSPSGEKQDHTGFLPGQAPCLTTLLFPSVSYLTILFISLGQHVTIGLFISLLQKLPNCFVREGAWIRQLSSHCVYISEPQKQGISLLHLFCTHRCLESLGKIPDHYWQSLWSQLWKDAGNHIHTELTLPLRHISLGSLYIRSQFKNVFFEEQVLLLFAIHINLKNTSWHQNLTEASNVSF